jgi:hypothetical protein
VCNVCSVDHWSHWTCVVSPQSQSQLQLHDMLPMRTMCLTKPSTASMMSVSRQVPSLSRVTGHDDRAVPGSCTLRSLTSCCLFRPGGGPGAAFDQDPHWVPRAAGPPATHHLQPQHFAQAVGQASGRQVAAHHGPAAQSTYRPDWHAMAPGSNPLLWTVGGGSGGSGGPGQWHHGDSGGARDRW